MYIKYKCSTLPTGNHAKLRILWPVFFSSGRDPQTPQQISSPPMLTPCLRPWLWPQKYCWNYAILILDLMLYSRVCLTVLHYSLLCCFGWNCSFFEMSNVMLPSEQLRSGFASHQLLYSNFDTGNHMSKTKKMMWNCSVLRERNSQLKPP